MTPHPDPLPRERELDGCREGPLHGVRGDLGPIVVLHRKHVRADTFASPIESIAIAPQVSFLKEHLMVAIRALHVHLEWLCAHELKPLRLFLVPVCFGDQAVQMGLHHRGIRSLPEVCLKPSLLRILDTPSRFAAGVPDCDATSHVRHEQRPLGPSFMQNEAGVS